MSDLVGSQGALSGGTRSLTLPVLYQQFRTQAQRMGKLADLMALLAKVMLIPEAESLKTKCVMMVSGGKIILEAGK